MPVNPSPLAEIRYGRALLSTCSAVRVKVRHSLQSSEFRFGLLENRNIGVGVLPQFEEHPLGGLAFGHITSNANALPSCRRADSPTGIARHDRQVHENLLKSSRRAVPRLQASELLVFGGVRMNTEWNSKATRVKKDFMNVMKFSGTPAPRRKTAAPCGSCTAPVGVAVMV